MFSHKYLSQKQLNGFKKYKYSSIDTSPISNYVMHPLWNITTKFIPNWIAPNVITFTGFLCLLIAILILIIYDYDCYAASYRPGKEFAYAMPQWIFTVCGVLLFLAYNLDGIDGKQARKIGMSGPLGELFDHGLDSYTVFFVPLMLFSVFGRDEYSISIYRGYLIIVSVTLNFYVSHVEKYNTGTLYLPWGYDISMWAATALLIVAGTREPGVFKRYVFGDINLVQVLEFTIHATGLLTTLPISIYNIYLSYKRKTGKMYPLTEAIRPVWPMLNLIIVSMLWAIKSPNDVIEYDPRAFLLIFGTLFSNISCRLILSQMSSQRCEVISQLTLLLSVGVLISVYQPSAEIPFMYLFMVFSILAHVHYGVCVVRQICQYYGINCFTVPKSKLR